MRNILFTGIAVAGILVSSCTSNSDDTSTPVISITQPATSQVYNAGDAVQIKGLLTDNHLHEAKITVSNDAGGPALFSKSIDVHGATSYTINESFTPVVAVVVNATVKVEVKDLTGNYAEKKIAVKINP